MDNLNLKILKAVLMMRKLGIKHQTKEEMLKEQKEWSKNPDYIDGMDEWINSLRADIRKTPEEREAESERNLELMMEREWELAQQEMEIFRYERNEWDDLWDDRARSVGAIRF